MSTLMPVSGGFVRLAGHWVDEAFGFMAGWVFYCYEALLIPFEIVALNLVLSYWSPNIPVAAICAACIVLYTAINLLAVRAYGEAEFWLSGGKVFLIFILFFFTFVTMCGGNPHHDAYGFRYWSNPGPFNEYLSTGSLGKFEGFLAALWGASFTIVGPEYISMAAAEAQRPRFVIKKAFSTVYWRFGAFFILGALCVGIVLPYNSPELVKILSGADGAGTAAASPYVIAMGNLGIGVLPHIVNALLCTSIFSAGNSYVYCASRTLYGLSLQGHAPKVLRTCKNGVPVYCLAITMLFPLLSFMSVSKGSAKALTILVDLITAGGIIDYIVMCITFLCYYAACKKQGVDRSKLPYSGRFQPYSAWIALFFLTLIVFVYGYSVFLPGQFTAADFFTYYTMVIVAPILYFGWKLVKRTRIVPSAEVDLVWERPVIDQYESSFLEPPTGFWREMGQMVGLCRRKNKAAA